MWSLPTWLLFDADWAHTRQSAQLIRHCSTIVPIGRVRWISDSPFTGKDNAAWYRFDVNHWNGPQFIGRDQPMELQHETASALRTFAAHPPRHSRPIAPRARWTGLWSTGLARLTRKERGFLFGVLTRQWPISLDDAALITAFIAASETTGEASMNDQTKKPELKVLPTIEEMSTPSQIGSQPLPCRQGGFRCHQGIGGSPCQAPELRKHSSEFIPMTTTPPISPSLNMTATTFLLIATCVRCCERKSSPSSSTPASHEQEEFSMAGPVARGGRQGQQMVVFGTQHCPGRQD